MRYTPVELRHVRAGRALFGGYKRGEVDRVLEDVADSFEEVWRERGELADRLEDVEKQLTGIQQRESLLASTLVSAERAAAEARDGAKREAELILAEAHQEARSVMRTAQTERERLFAEARRVETLLRAALGMVEETRSARPGPSVAGVETPAAVSPDEQPPPPVLEWPRREDTREFHAVTPDEGEPSAQAEPAALPPVTDAGGGESEGPWAGRDFAWG